MTLPMSAGPAAPLDATAAATSVAISASDIAAGMYAYSSILAALIERGRMGGDCLNTGCVPSKSLLAAAHAAETARGARRFGIRAEPVIDWDAVHEAVRRLAPDALLAVDVTQAIGRVPRLCPGADLVISSTHKWVLGLHGGCIVGIPERAATRLTTHAGGWFHLRNAFDADRFQRADTKAGAASFSVGMPNFAAIYALNAALRYVESVGVAAIAQHADPLVAQVHAGLLQLGLQPMAPAQPTNPTGILAFRHPNTAAIHAALEGENIHVMHHAGRLRIAVHGYNTAADVEKLLAVLATVIQQRGN